MHECAHEQKRMRAHAYTHMCHHPVQQWLTVFGGICFMLVDLIDFQNGKNQPGIGKVFIGTLIFM
jgi:hypothetical protein